MTELTPETLQLRRQSAWTRREKALRMLWATVQHTLFRLSPYPCNRWRVVLLRMFGARIGTHVTIRRTVQVEIPWNLTIGDHASVGDAARLYALGAINIGSYTTVSQYAHLCAGTHDHEKAESPLVVAPITIHENAWVAADAFVGPGVKIGEGAILGARGCAFKDIPAWTIYGGNPARFLKTRVQSGKQG